MTTEEKNAKKLALIEERKQKRAEKKAKREAKRAAKLEKRRAMIELKKQKRAEKKAKKLAKLEKEKARKAALREKKRLAREKKHNAEKAMKLKLKIQAKKQKTIIKVDKSKKNNDVIDIKFAAKNIKIAMSQLANEMAKLDDETRSKKAKAIRGMGYDVETTDGNIIVRFIDEKSKKLKISTKKTIDKPIEPEIVEQPNENDEDEPKVEMIPVGDLLGTDGKVDNSEIANIDDDSEIPSEDDEDSFEDDDDTISDSRDETDIDLIESRREFFNNAADFGEDIDN